LNEVDAHVDLNARFMARLTTLLLPVLTRQDRSLILNLSSPARMGMPWLCEEGSEGLEGKGRQDVGREEAVVRDDY